MSNENFPRIEDANSGNSILKISANSEINTTVLLNRNTVLNSFEELINNKILFRLNGSFLDDSEYGNLITISNLLRVYSETQDESWVDITITDVYYDIAYPGETIIEGIIIDGLFSSISVGDEVQWGFWKQKTPDKDQLLSTRVTNITDTSAQISIINLLKSDNNLFYQVKHRLQEDTSWEYSILGNWIFEFKVIIEATNLPKPNRTFSGKNVLWAQTPKPDIEDGVRASAWVEIINGNFGEIFFLQDGGGYRQEPKIEFYYTDPEPLKIINPHYRKPFWSTNEIIIEEDSHGFIDGDEIQFDGDIIKGLFEIFDSTVNTFKITSPSFIMLEDDNLLKQEEGQINLKNLVSVSKPGELKPVISKDIYNIKLLSTNRVYEYAVIPYFSNDLKSFGEYTKSEEFTTR